jgi:predicted Zn-dependent peptidase
MTVVHTTAASGLKPSRQVLANGLTVLSKQTTVTPAVTINASIRAGAVFDPPELAGVAHFASKTIDRGTTHRSAEHIAEELDSRGVSLATSVTRQTLTLTCTCLVEDFEVILSQLADIIRQPAFPAAEVGSRRTEVVTLIRQDEDSPAAVAVDGLMEALYSSAHPYGRKLRGTIETVERVDSGVLRAFHNANITPTSVSLAIVGDVAPQRAVDAASAAFVGWAASSSLALEMSPPPAPAGRRTE